jgi:hypothetical protein
MAARTRRSLSAVAVLLALLLGPVEASDRTDDLCGPQRDRWYEDKARGWYHFEYCKKKAARQAEKKDATRTEKRLPDLVTLRDPAFLDALDTRQFKDLFAELKEQVVYRPDRETMLTYLVMQDYMQKKAVRFASVWQDTLLSYPEYNHAVKSPASNYGALIKTHVNEKDTARVLRDLAQHTGLFLFASAECPYCLHQAEILGRFARTHSFATRTMSKDHCADTFPNCASAPQAFELLNIKVTPTIVAVFRDTSGTPRFQVIATGLLTESEIAERLVFYHTYFSTGSYPLG